MLGSLAETFVRLLPRKPVMPLELGRAHRFRRSCCRRGGSRQWPVGVPALSGGLWGAWAGPV